MGRQVSPTLKVILGTIALALSGTTATFAAAYLFDQANNPYPPECQRDLTQEPVIQQAMTEGRLVVKTVDLGGTHGGLTVINPKLIVVMVSSRLGGWKALDAKQHELCHAYLELIGKNPFWHGPAKGTQL